MALLLGLLRVNLQLQVAHGGGAFDRATTFISSPPGAIVAGAVLAGIVWKFFDRVDDTLNDPSKLQIADWLLQVRAADGASSWSKTFPQVFDRVFGKKHLSGKCFFRPCVASAVSFTLVLVHQVGFGNLGQLHMYGYLLPLFFTCNLVPDYISLLESRYLLSRMTKSSVKKKRFLIFVDALITFGIAVLALIAMSYLMQLTDGGMVNGIGTESRLGNGLRRNSETITYLLSSMDVADPFGDLER